MLFRCPKCKKEINRDMRLLANKAMLTKRGYKSICESSSQLVYLKPVNNK